MLGQYFVRDFSAASLELMFGIAFMLFGVGYATHYMTTPHATAASAGVVMAAALPVILGAQLLMQALNFDVLNVPSRPIHPYLRTIARMEAEETAT
jgi:dolichol-phosphate mannosyltransferase